jgi:hypothetical protein
MSLPYKELQKSFVLGVIAIDSDAIKIPLWKPNSRIKITKVRLGADTACTKADTNYNTFQLTDVTNVIASIANGPNSAAGQTFAAGAMYDMTLVAAYQEMAADVQLQFEIVKTGNGLALTRSVLEISYYDYGS